jgi:hypothetical protein
MLTDPQLDPLGSIIVEARNDADLASLVGVRVRGVEPAPGDADGPGGWQAFVVVTALTVPVMPTVPVTFAEYGVRCYGTTHQNAWAVWGAFVKAFHGAGPRVRESNGLGIYRTSTSGGEQSSDPDTNQPVVLGTLRVIATASEVAAGS